LPPACSSVITLVVALEARRHAAAVVGDGNGIVGVNRDVDVVAIARERFVDGVVQHFEYEVMQTGAIRRIADIHARALAHRLQTFEDLNGRGAIAVVGLRIRVFSHEIFRFCVTAELLLETFRITLKTPKGRAAPWNVFGSERVRCASASPRI
jgi:UDP-N-acetylenolpyruvoylglucosamine reductase